MPPAIRMDPPEEKNDRYYSRRAAEDSRSEARLVYTLGDEGKPEDMAVTFKSAADQLWALSRLQPNDPCFILRSCGRFTFAKVLSRERGGDGAEAHIEVQVNDEGCTKTIPMIQCPKYIRLLKAPQAQHPSTKQKGHPTHQRGASWNQEVHPSAPKQMQRPTHQRRATVDTSCPPASMPRPERTTSDPREQFQRQSSLNFQPGRSRRPPSQLRRHESLNAGNFQPGRSRRPQSQLHASLNAGQLQRRSSFIQSDNNLSCSDLRPALKRSSIITKEGSDRHVSWNLSDDAYELSSVESDSDDSTVESSSSSSSFEEEEEPSPSPTKQQAPHRPPPRRKDITKKGVHMLVESDSDKNTGSSSSSSDDSASPSPSPTDVKKVVHLPGFDIEFNEKSLVDAFRTISSKRGSVRR